MNFDCIICFERYNDSNRKPHVLIPCGHTICGECLESIDNCPKCRKNIEKTVENWDLIPSHDTRPSVPPQMSSINDQNRDPLWVSLRKYLVIDVDEKKKELFKALQEKQNEQQNKANVIKSKIQDEANHKIESILKKTDELIREVNMQDSKISSELEKIFQENQNYIEKESKFIKAKVESHQLNDLDEMESLKKKSDILKNKIVTKSNEIKNMKINFKIEMDKFFSEDGELRTLPERNQSSLIAVNSDESKVNLIQECKSLCHGRGFKVKDIDVTKVIQNPSLINGWEEAFRKYCLRGKISNELTNRLIKNSKIINWPNELNSMELMKKNKAEFLKLLLYGMWNDAFYDAYALWNDAFSTSWYVVFEHNNMNLKDGIRPNIAFVLVTSENLTLYVDDK